MPPDEVAVIIPTRALPERRALLERALASVRSQDGVMATPVVVVNGTEFDRSFVEELTRDRRTRVILQQRADLPAALRLGRSQVTAPWFTSLDDDDEIVPGGLSTRVRALTGSDRFDAVVSNGFCREDGRDSLVAPDMNRVARDPLAALEHGNWLLPGAWLCRTDAASQALFEGMPKYLECTFLAIRLCTSRRLRFIDDPTVVWHADTPRSLSKSHAYRFGQAAALRSILELHMPPGLRRCMHRRLSAAFHDTAGLLMDQGRMSAAWAHHARSVFGHRGWRFLPYTRKLIARSLRTGRPVR